MNELMGAAMFSLAVWIRFQDDFREWVEEMKMEHYWDGIWVLFVCGLLVMGVSFFGCCGALTESPCMVGTVNQLQLSSSF
ncbi:unnamed protein product, partial [Notodromas monacha]